jgi:hypothetical protein
MRSVLSTRCRLLCRSVKTASYPSQIGGNGTERKNRRRVALFGSCNELLPLLPGPAPLVEGTSRGLHGADNMFPSVSPDANMSQAKLPADSAIGCTGR